MDNDSDPQLDYGYYSAERWDNDYLVKPLSRILDSLGLKDKRLFEIGYGNGWIADFLTKRGYTVTGVEPSESGVSIACSTYPDLNLQAGNAYDDLHKKFGTFPVVYSVEVIEHCQYPRKFAATAYDLLEPGGTAIITTPYHGYLKNLVIALMAKTDTHFDPLWDEGHLRFFSEKTLKQLLLKAKFNSVEFKKTGRFAPLHKSMIAIARK